MSPRSLFVFSLAAGLIALFAALLLSVAAPSPTARDVEFLTPPELRVRSTPVSRAAAPVILRVAVTERVRELTIEVAGPYRLQRVSQAKPLHKAKALTRTAVVPTTDGMRLGAREWTETALEIIPENPPAVWVGDHLYRGSVRLHKVGNRVLAVNVLPLEDYLASVIDSEMPAAFPLEARKAQAIVARTFALYQRDSASSSALNDLGSSVKSQKYLGYQYRAQGRLLAGESSGSRQAVRETQGLIGTYHNTPFCTYYSAVCGGQTLTGREIFDDAAPVLKSVRCGFCEEARLYRWTATFPKADVLTAVEKLLNTRGTSVGRVKSVVALKRGQPGTLPEFDVRGERRSTRVSGFEIRQAFITRGINSPRFTLAEQAGQYVFTGQGHGHGAGLCQWGARGLALDGRTAREIVEFYYPGCVVKRVE